MGFNNNINSKIGRMLEITTVENILMAITLLFLTLYVFASLVQNKPHWFMSKRLLKVRKM